MTSTGFTSVWSASPAIFASCDSCATCRSPEYLRHEVYAGRYLVQVAAQTCIDLANHVIASEGWRAPRDFGDSFTVLHEHGVIDDALAGRLRGLAGLRNRLVHVYDEIDDVRVHEALATGLPDLDAFATAVARLAS